MTKRYLNKCQCVQGCRLRERMAYVQSFISRSRSCVGAASGKVGVSDCERLHRIDRGAIIAASAPQIEVLFAAFDAQSVSRYNERDCFAAGAAYDEFDAADTRAPAKKSK